MKLRNGIIRPGKVIKVLDEGCILAQVPGLFNREDIDNLPPILPFPFNHNSNNFSSVNEFDEVWVINFSDNPMQLYWIRKDDMKENNREILKEENVEILCNRENDMTWATIYFSDGSGWVIKNDDSIIQIKSDGSILLDSGLPKRAIDINTGSISLGSIGKSKHSAAFGDVVIDALENIQVTLSMIQKTAGMSPFTSPIAAGIGQLPLELKTIIPKVASSNVTLE